MTRNDLINALELNNWYVKRAAQSLNINRNTFTNLMKKFKIEKQRNRGERPNRPEWKCLTRKNVIKARNTWYKIIDRCNNQNNKDYKSYGGRGITICNDWLNSLDLFYDYCITLDNAFKNGYSIDRIDNNLGYAPNNVRFVKHKAQCNNRRSNRKYTFKDQTKNISEWAEEYDLKWEFVRDRLDLGWTIEESLTIPRYGRRNK